LIYVLEKVIESNIALSGLEGREIQNIAFDIMKARSDICIIFEEEIFITYFNFPISDFNLFTLINL